MKHDALFLEPTHPAAQQGRCLAVHRKHTAGAADVSVNTQHACPVAQRPCVEVLQPCGDRLLTLAIALRKQRHRIGMGEVQTAFAGNQKLAPHRALGLVQIHCQARSTGHFCRHQAGRPTTDHGQPPLVRTRHRSGTQRGCTSSNSTSKTNEAPGGITPPAPLSP